ncbi:MAG TPA: Crp/Fnr family transcriptional regulator [Saprospiraceae bacterium]|nr:Crp/Fnr family transcriptional regulator [Saprospiraceae bacterium]
MMTRVLEVLESIPFFAVLSPRDRETLALQMEYMTTPKHSYIYTEGDLADSFFILAEGSIKIGTHHEDGREVIKQVLHPRSVFGEMALIQQHSPYHNYAMALSATTGYYKIKVEDFRQIMDKSPQITMSIISMLGLKLRQTENQLESLIFRDARGRIIDFILKNAQASGRQVGFETLLKHSLTQQDIANYTGTSRQTVTAVLNDLRKMNKIYFTRNSILIRDMAALA